MKTILAVALILLAVPSVKAQQHAPSVEVCRGDVALWYSAEISNEYQNAQTEMMRGGNKNRTLVSQLSIMEVTARLDEMAKCYSVESSDSRYYSAFKFYQEVLSDRYMRFVLRHSLLDQLKREDAQGIR